MKKIFSILFILMLSACASPQVTVTSEVTVTLAPPTETPIPTPTLHPQFIEVQNLIADSGERFTLLLDGTIEETNTDGIKQIIPNFHVDQNGIFNLMVNNEHVVIDQSQITFDDKNGLIIDGYELENDEWVEAVPILTPEVLWQQETTKWNLNTDNYRVAYDVDGKLVVVQRSTQEVVYWDGYWNLNVMRKMIVEDGSCYLTRWVGTKGQSIHPKEDKDAFYKLFMFPFDANVKTELIRLGILSDFPVGYMEYLGGEGNCWAITRVKKLGQNPSALELNHIFWLNNDKELQHESVFNPKLKKIVVASD